MKLVVTDGTTLSGGGVSLERFSRYAQMTVYDLTPPEQLAERIADADAVLCNKTPIPAAVFDQCPKLRYIGECATGYNNIDIAAAKAHGVTVCNVAGYSTDAVAQHTFALILHDYSRVAQYDAAVRQGAWKQAKTFCIMPYPMQELAGKKLAVVGYGSIGRKVAAIGAAFGMEVLVATRTQPQNCPYPLVSLDEAFRQADVLTLHTPLTEQTAGMVSAARLRTMKPTALLVRTDRGSRPGAGAEGRHHCRRSAGRADGRAHGGHTAGRSAQLHHNPAYRMDTAGNQTAPAGACRGKPPVLSGGNPAECDYCPVRRI